MSLPRLIGFLVVGVGLIAVGTYGMFVHQNHGWWISLAATMIGIVLIVCIPGFADD